MTYCPLCQCQACVLTRKRGDVLAQASADRANLAAFARYTASHYRDQAVADAQVDQDRPGPAAGAPDHEGQ